jgi:hypothetical protein
MSPLLSQVRIRYLESHRCLATANYGGQQFAEGLREEERNGQHEGQ